MNSLVLSNSSNNRSYYPLKMATTMKDIPDVLIKEILSFLNFIGLGRCLRLNRIWRKIGNQRDLWKVPSSMTVFGKRQWAMYLGEIGEEPPIPRKFYSLFERPCPFNPEKQIKSSHKLLLMPGSINNLPFTITNFAQAIMHSKEVLKTDMSGMEDPRILSVDATEVPMESHWLLITKKIIPGTEIEDFTKQCKFLPSGYVAPNMLQAIASLFESSLSDATDSFCITTQCNESLYGLNLTAVAWKSGSLSKFSEKETTIYIDTIFRYERLGLLGVLQ